MRQSAFRVCLLLIAGAVMSVAGADAASAQAYATYRPPTPRLQGHVMAGYSATSGVTSDYLYGGWILDGGVSYWPGGGWLGLRGDLSYSAHAATNGFINFEQHATGEQIDQGSGDFASIAAGLALRGPRLGSVRFYGLAQASITHVRLQLTQTFYFPGYFCDPFFGYCEFASSFGGATVYDRNATRWGWNVGIGVQFPGYFGEGWFIEAQYRRVQTSQPFEYWPVTVGFRF